MITNGLRIEIVTDGRIGDVSVWLAHDDAAPRSGVCIGEGDTVAEAIDDAVDALIVVLQDAYAARPPYPDVGTTIDDHVHSSSCTCYCCRPRGRRQ